MTVSLEPLLRTHLASPHSARVLATTGPQGDPHAVLSPALEVDEAGCLLYLEPLEASRTQRDLVASIWFDRPVAVVVAGCDGTTWRIRGRVRKAHVAGPLFRERYERLRAERPGADLAAVWEIEPLEVSDESYATLRARQDAERPFFKHLDQLARKTPGRRAP
ncbi:MAG TPA: hypothetical protein VF875_00710 [Anaeromyxobacter sp.]